jgi:regulator of replication initiation timing
MKPLLCLLFCCSFTLLAQQQWPEADCAKATKKLQQLEQKISSGYSLKEAEQLSLDQRQLEKQLDQFCQKPASASDTQKPKAKKSEAKKTAKTKNPPDALADIAKGPELYVSSVSVKAPYQGKKLQAWLEYYSEPKQCFGVRDSKQMVWCVEQRQQAKANFERQWQQKFALSQPE